jgi:hypothetical protein
VGQPTGFDVDTGLLVGIAGKAIHAGTTTGAAYTANQNALSPTGAVSGWSTAQVAASATSAWGGFIQRLAASISGLGDDLKTAATRYAQADVDAARRQHHGGRQFE